MTKIVSKKIRASARGESCALRVSDYCGHDDETVVFAHLNTNFSGMGIKSPDIFGVYSCSTCHTLLDSSSVHAHHQLRALMETQMKLFEKGLIIVK